MVIRSLLAILTAAGLAGCVHSFILSPTLPITVDGPLEAPRIRSHADLLGQPCISSLGMHDQTDRASGAVWGTGTPGLDCLHIPEMIYGQPPAGFVTRIGPRPLKPGVVYVIAAGGPVTYGGRRFAYDGGRWRAVE